MPGVSSLLTIGSVDRNVNRWFQVSCQPSGTVGEKLVLYSIMLYDSFLSVFQLLAPCVFWGWCRFSMGCKYWWMPCWPHSMLCFYSWCCCWCWCLCLVCLATTCMAIGTLGMQRGGATWVEACFLCWLL